MKSAEFCQLSFSSHPHVQIEKHLALLEYPLIHCCYDCTFTVHKFLKSQNPPSSEIRPLFLSPVNGEERTKMSSISYVRRSESPTYTRLHPRKAVPRLGFHHNVPPPTQSYFTMSSHYSLLNLLLPDCWSVIVRRN
jgi:hypothetical protein